MPSRLASIAAATVFSVVAIAPAAAQCPPAIQRLFDARRLDEARTEAVTNARRAPRDAAAHACAGRIAMGLDKPGEAIDAYERAVELEPRNADHHVRLGEAYGMEAQRVGRVRQAVLARRIKSEFERAVELDPRQVEARMGLVQFYAIAPGVMGGSMDKAREQAAAIGRLNAMRGHLASAYIAERQRDYAGAERAYLAASAATPADSMSGHFALGSFYQRREEWAKAFALYDRLIAQRPADMTLRQQYGRAVSISGQNLERGERELRAFLANQPPNTTVTTTASVHYRLGLILEKLDRKDEARTEYETAVRMNPRNEDAKRALTALR